MVKNPSADAGNKRDTGSIHRFDLWVGKIPWRRRWQPTPGLLPGKPHGQRTCSPWGRRRVRYD